MAQQEYSELILCHRHTIAIIYRGTIDNNAWKIRKKDLPMGSNLSLENHHKGYFEINSKIELSSGTSL